MRGVWVAQRTRTRRKRVVSGVDVPICLRALTVSRHIDVGRIISREKQDSFRDDAGE